MDMSEARQVARRPSYLSPTVGPDGAWASAGAHALRAALRQRSPRGVMGLLKSMDAQGMAQVLQEAGFPVSGLAVMQGRDAVFAGAKQSLQSALQRGVDGWAQPGRRPAPSRNDVGGQRAQPTGAGQTVPKARLEANAEGLTAAEMVQSILSSPSVRVLPAGDVPLHQRPALQMVAGQALQKRVLGFGFDGVPGKFDVPAPLAEVAKLHHEAASAVAVESARTGLAAWAAGARVTNLSEWVPDSVQRLLHGSVSPDAAKIIVNAISNGTLAAHAREYGVHGIADLLSDRGLDVNAPTVDQLAATLEVRIKAPDRERGQYFGDVVAQDHRASLIKVNRGEAIELPHAAIPGERPKVGDQMRLNYKAGALTVSKTERLGRSDHSR